MDNRIHIPEEKSIDKHTILSKFKKLMLIKCSPEIILSSLFDNNYPIVRNAHRNGGYRWELENIFRLNNINVTIDDGSIIRQRLMN